MLAVLVDEHGQEAAPLSMYLQHEMPPWKMLRLSRPFGIVRVPAEAVMENEKSLVG
jgi:hypothetical protein